MSGNTLYLGTVLEPLAEKLDELLQAESAALKDPFLPATIIVPSADVKTWLQLYLARKQSVAINLRIYYLENALWNILGDLTTLRDPVHRLEHENYRLLILSILLEDAPSDPELKPLADYLGQKDLQQREFCRRVWDLSDTLARLIRDYEYHRQEDFIHPWIFKSEIAGLPPNAAKLERCQRALFMKIVADKTGLRERLSQSLKRACKTLPQYAQEVMREKLRDRELWPAALRDRAVHVFGVAQISPYHIHVLRWLSSQLTLRFYHVNPLVSRIDGKLCARDPFKALQQTAARFQADAASGSAPGDALLSAWGPAAAATFQRMSELLQPGGAKKLWSCEVLPGAERKGRTALERVQNDLFAPPKKTPAACAQDKSVQIAACPGIFREVETVWNSIVANLLRDPELRLSDIAVYVPRMALYRPVIQTVFDRDVQLPSGVRLRAPLEYTLGECRAADLSVFGQALLQMCDAALEGFPRTRVLDVLTNPCFLARVRATPEQTSVWLNWAEQLGIYHGWDQQDKKESGYTDSPLYSWRRALQRLRLGRIMEPPSGAPDLPLPAYRDVVPYSDLESGDPEQLNAFCQAVEELLPRLTEFRRRPASGAQWADRIRTLAGDFLAAPEDRADEAAVCNKLLGALDLLRTLDAVATKNEKLTLPLIREFLAAQLEELGASGASGRYGSVTITSLQSAQPVPYKIVYVLGLGEGVFPSPTVTSPFDLREHQPLATDIRPGAAQRLQFLDVLAAARQKVYLLFSCKELQKDQTLYPSTLLNQLREYYAQYVLPKSTPSEMPLLDGPTSASGFQPVQLPLIAHDPLYLQEQTEFAQITDLFANFRRADRVLALQDALAAGQLDLGCPPEQAQTRITTLAQQARTELLRISEANGEEPRPIARINIRDLRAYLNDPARAALRRHLKIQTEDEIEPCDDEPFYTDDRETMKVVQTALQRYVAKAAAPGVEKPDYEAEFAEAYEDRRRVGLAPDREFAEADRARLRAILRRRIEGASSSLAEFVDRQDKPAFCGRVQFGQSHVPAGAQIHFPALHIPLQQAGATVDVQLSGACDLVWRTSDRIELAVILQGCKVPADTLSHFLFEPVLFYLALLAGTEKAATGESAAAWVGARPLHVSIAHDDDISEFRYTRIESVAAREYLSALVADYLSPRTFDHLPFRIANNKDLSPAFSADDGPDLEVLRASYADEFAAALEQEEENGRAKPPRIDPLDLIELRVPDDAFEKVRRRFRLLDLGPRTNRESKPQSSARPGKKKK